MIWVCFSFAHAYAESVFFALPKNEELEWAWLKTGGWVCEYDTDKMALTFMVSYLPSTLCKMKHMWTLLNIITEVDCPGAIWDSPPKAEQWWQKDPACIFERWFVTLIVCGCSQEGFQCWSIIHTSEILHKSESLPLMAEILHQFLGS